MGMWTRIDSGIRDSFQHLIDRVERSRERVRESGDAQVLDIPAVLDELYSLQQRVLDVVSAETPCEDLHWATARDRELQCEAARYRVVDEDGVRVCSECGEPICEHLATVAEAATERESDLQYNLTRAVELRRQTETQCERMRSRWLHAEADAAVLVTAVQASLEGGGKGGETPSQHQLRAALARTEENCPMVHAGTYKGVGLFLRTPDGAEVPQRVVDELGARLR